MPVRPCLTCDALTTNTPAYCDRHQTGRRKNKPAAHTRSRQWRNLSTAMLAAHRMTYGDWCPGLAELEHVPHQTPDLVVDHIRPVSAGGAVFDPANLRVICRGANSRRATQAMPASPHP